MVLNLVGKVALITGGAQGLGRAFAERLLAQGAKVSLLDVKRHVGQATESELRQQFGIDSTVFIHCDVTDKSDLKDAFQKTKEIFGGLDIVVNNAGIDDEINWERTILVNLNAVIYGSRLGLETMRRDKGGNGGLIVNVASLAGLTAMPLGTVYTASKFGVVGYSQSLAETYPLDAVGVRVACLCPSYVKTEISENIPSAVRNLKSPVLRNAAKRVQTMIEKHGAIKPSDVADALIQLVNEDRAHGAVLTVTPSGQEYTQPKHLRGKL